MTTRYRLSVLALALGGLAAVQLGVSWLALDQARTRSMEAWREISLLYAGRSVGMNAALHSEAQRAVLDPRLLDTARRALDRAAGLRPDEALLDDPQALDRFKRYQGELTGAMFQLVATARSSPALNADPVLQALQQDMVSTEGKLASARERYRDRARTYNSLTADLPSAMAARLTGYAAVPIDL